jgi:hypothetical protein
MNRSLAKRDQILQRIQEERIASKSNFLIDVAVLRRLAKQREKIETEGKREKRDIISDFANYGSEVYAPLMRSGKKPEVVVPEMKSATLSNYFGIEAMETKLMKPNTTGTDTMTSSVSGFASPTSIRMTNSPPKTQRKVQQILKPYSIDLMCN